MRHRLITAALPSSLALIVALGAGGCGKKTAEPAPPPQVPAAQAPAQTTQPLTQTSGQPAVQKNGEPDLSDINRTLIRWIIRNKRRPASFEDFAATADAPIPPAPAGKKYVIAPNMHVQLVNL